MVVYMIILASKSSRRAKLLEDAGIEFTVVPSEINEEVDSKLKPQELVSLISLQKALDVQKRRPNDTIIGADTVVIFENEIFGKPKDEEDAFRMLKMLSGETHQVITGVTILKKDVKKVIISEALVTMKKYSDLEIREYIQTKEPMDKAGSYGIQGEGGKLIDHFKGDFFTIVGLPLKDVLEVLKSLDNK